MSRKARVTVAVPGQGRGASPPVVTQRELRRLASLGPECAELVAVIRNALALLREQDKKG